MDSIRNDLSERELSEEEAHDRVQWRRLIRHIDPHIKVRKYTWEEEYSINNYPSIKVPLSIEYWLSRFVVRNATAAPCSGECVIDDSQSWKYIVTWAEVAGRSRLTS